MFSELLETVFLCLLLIWEDSQPLLPLFLYFFPPLAISTTCIYIFYKCHIILLYFILYLLFFFSVCILDLGIFVYSFSGSLILSSAMSNLLMSLSKTTLSFITGFFFYFQHLLFILVLLSLCLNNPIVFACCLLFLPEPLAYQSSLI